MSDDLFSVNRLYARALIQSADRLALPLPPELRQAVEDHARLPLATLDRLWDAYCAASGDPLAGLRLGLELQAGHLDCVGMLLASCDTLGEALKQLVEVAPIVGEGGDFVIENDGDLATVHYRPHLALRQAERVEAALMRAGLPPEPRKFAPHVTLARLKNPPSARVGDFLREHGVFRAPPFAVQGFALYSSILGAAGPTYREEAFYPLSPNGPVTE